MVCYHIIIFISKKEILSSFLTHRIMGAQLLSGRVLDSRPRGRGFEPDRRHCVVSLSKNINPSLVYVLVQPRKTRPFITERLLMGRKESNQTNKQTHRIRIFEILPWDRKSYLTHATKCILPRMSSNAIM